MHTFISGLERDLAAVTAGLTLPWSSDPLVVAMLPLDRFAARLARVVQSWPPWSLLDRDGRILHADIGLGERLAAIPP